MILMEDKVYRKSKEELKSTNLSPIVNYGGGGVLGSHYRYILN